MIYRNKIERKNQQQLHLTRCLWEATLPQMLAIVRTSQIRKNVI